MDLIKEKKLGFGCMRMSLLDPDDLTSFDYEKIEQLFDRYLEQGFTYFDVAYTYHGYHAEEAVKKALVERYPREKFQLATKLPLRDFKEAWRNVRQMDRYCERTSIAGWQIIVLGIIIQDMV